MFRAALLALLLTMVPAAGATAQNAGRDSEVSVETPTGRLAGTLTTPARAGDAAVLILPGSGPTDRNGDNPATGPSGTYRLLAEALAERGVASLRFDKRGLGGSAGAIAREEDLRFTANVDDALAWLELLRSRTGARRVFVFGHSEGALTAALIAQRADLAGVILAAGAGRPAVDVIREQLRAGATPPELAARADAVFDALRRDETVDDVPAALAALFRPSIQPYLRSWLFLDPAEELARSRVPALVLQGDRDVQIPVADARRLAAARPGVRLTVLPGVSHILKPAPEDRAGNIASYADPALPLAPAAVDAVAEFIARPGVSPPR